MMGMNRIGKILVLGVGSLLLVGGLVAGAVGREGRPTGGTSAAAADQAEPPKVAPPNLPRGPAPVQVLASVNAAGEVVVKRLRAAYVPVSRPLPDGRVQTRYEQHLEVRTEHHKLKEVSAHGVDGKSIGEKDLRKRLAKETPVLASTDGRPVDPLHLRLIRPGTVILVLPLPAPQVAPVPPPAVAVPPVGPVVPPAAAPPPLPPETPPPAQQAPPPPPDKVEP